MPEGLMEPTSHPIPSEGIGKAIARGVNHFVGPLVDSRHVASARYPVISILSPIRPGPHAPADVQAQGNKTPAANLDSNKGPPKAKKSDKKEAKSGKKEKKHDKKETKHDAKGQD